MKELSRLIVFACLVFTVQASAQHQDYFPDSSLVVRQRLEEWQDLKFGLLMHWGPYSQWGIVESWSICPEDLSWATGGRKPGVDSTYTGYVAAYEKLQTTFNPVQFDPAKWADAALNAGMKYVVFTTKHHDGFCMFDSQFTDYKITDEKTPFHSNPKRDVTKEIFTAFGERGFWLGAYFSKPDWHCNDYWWDHFPPADRNCNYAISKYPERWQAYKDFTHAQINELVTKYGPLDILWLDGGWVRPTTNEEVSKYLLEEYEGSRWARNPQNQDIDMGAIVRKARLTQPELIVVDRAVTGPYQNYLTPEQHIPETGLPYPWETCMTMATSWSYVPNDQYKSSDALIKSLVDVVSKGGNFLLNIAPSPEGTLDSIAYARLHDIGQWIDVNGEAIYNTRMYDVFGEGDRVRYTRSKDGKTIYVFFTQRIIEPIALEHLPYSTKYTISLLGSKQKVKSTNQNGHLQLSLPKDAEGKFVWVVKIQLS